MDREVYPAEVLGRWHLTLNTLADNDNAPAAGPAMAVVAMLGLPIFSTAAVAGFIRYVF